MTRRYFAKHTEIAWSKSVRATYDHTGQSDSRAASHHNRLMYPGIKNIIGYDINVFPFKFTSFDSSAPASATRDSSAQAAPRHCGLVN